MHNSEKVEQIAFNNEKLSTMKRVHSLEFTLSLASTAAPAVIRKVLVAKSPRLADSWRGVRSCCTQTIGVDKIRR